MVNKRSQTERILVALLAGEARHRARWRELSAAKETVGAAGRAPRLRSGGRRGPPARPARLAVGALAQPVLAQPAAQLYCALTIHRCFCSPARTPPRSGGSREAGRLTAVTREAVQAGTGIPSPASRERQPACGGKVGLR